MCWSKGKEGHGRLSTIDAIDTQKCDFSLDLEQLWTTPRSGEIPIRAGRCLPNAALGATIGNRKKPKSKEKQRKQIHQLLSPRSLTLSALAMASITAGPWDGFDVLVSPDHPKKRKAKPEHRSILSSDRLHVIVEHQRLFCRSFVKSKSTIDFSGPSLFWAELAAIGF